VKNADRKGAEGVLKLDRETLVSTIAHEMRNPLAAILLACSNIRRKTRSPAVIEKVKTIEKKSSEANRFLTNLLSCSRRRKPAAIGARRRSGPPSPRP